MINIRKIEISKDNITTTSIVNRLSERKIDEKRYSNVSESQYILSDNKWWIYLTDKYLYDLNEYKMFLLSTINIHNKHYTDQHVDEINTYIRLNKLNEVTQ